MAENPIVSVITIFLNEEKFIKEAIESVIAQSYDHWELLLMDDGSTDRSSEIAQDYARKFPEKVIYLEHPDHQNRGMSASRNVAISKARGEYLSFIDGDDVWFPKKLHHQVANMQSNPEVVMVCSPAQLWYSWTGKLEDQQRDLIQEFPIETNCVVEAPVLFNLYLENEFFSICDFLIRKYIVESVGGYEDSFRGMYEDQVFHSKVCLKHPVFVTKETWYRYRRHPNSCTHKSLRCEDHQIKRKSFLLWLEHYLKNPEFGLPEVKQCFDRAIWPYRHPLLFRLIGQPNKKNFKHLVDRTAKSILPKKSYEWLYHQFRYKNWPPVGWIRFGSLRRLTPFSHVWSTRGQTIDRYYIDDFLEKNKEDIQGHVLEIAESKYTWKFGAERVAKSDVLHLVHGNPAATMVGDLTKSDFIPSDTFDCIILTQTIMMVFDFRAIIESVYRILKPGGVLLLTVPCISQIVAEDDKEWYDYWRFTRQSLERLFAEFFPADSISVGAYGNVLSATGFLYGIASEELQKSELDHYDPLFPLIINLKAVKPTE